MYRTTRLKCGVTVATAGMPQMASACVGLWVGVGSRHEAAKVNGASHFIEHLLFKGTRKRSAKEISEAVEGIGGYLNAFTSEENTCYYAKASSDHYRDLLEVLLDMFLNSTFDPIEIDKERDVIKEELAMYMDQPHQQVLEILNEVMWPGHALGRCITGTDQTLDRLQRRPLLNYRRKHYVSHNTIITAAGNVNHEKLVKAVRRFAPLVPLGSRSKSTPIRDHQRDLRIRLHTKKAEQTQLALGIKTCSRHDPRRYALRVLNTVLGENMSSHLFQVLRENHGLVYTVYSSLGFFDDAGTMTITAGLDTDKLSLALELIVSEMKSLKDQLLPKPELRRAKDYLIGQLALHLESTENRMIWLGEQLLGFDNVFPQEIVRERLERVTAEEVRASARDFLRPDRFSLTLVSPRKSERGLQQILRR